MPRRSLRCRAATFSSCPTPSRASGRPVRAGQSEGHRHRRRTPLALPARPALPSPNAGPTALLRRRLDRPSAPARTPEPILDKLSAEVMRISQGPCGSREDEEPLLRTARHRKSRQEFEAYIAIEEHRDRAQGDLVPGCRGLKIERGQIRDGRRRWRPRPTRYGVALRRKLARDGRPRWKRKEVRKQGTGGTRDARPVPRLARHREPT